MHDEQEHRWNWRQNLGAAGFAALAIWLVAAFGPDSYSTHLSNAGQALGSIATAVGIGVVFLSLRQLELQRRALADQLGGSDREFRLRSIEALRVAYADWFAAADAVLLSLLRHQAAYEAEENAARVPEAVKAFDLTLELSKKAHILSLLEVSSPRLARVKGIGGEIADVMMDAITRPGPLEVDSQDQRKVFDPVDLKAKLQAALEATARELQAQAAEKPPVPVSEIP